MILRRQRTQLLNALPPGTKLLTTKVAPQSESWAAVTTHVHPDTNHLIDVITPQAGHQLTLLFGERPGHNVSRITAGNGRIRVTASGQTLDEGLHCHSSAHARALIEQLRPKRLTIYADQDHIHQATDLIDLLSAAGQWWSGYSVAGATPRISSVLDSHTPKISSVHLHELSASEQAWLIKELLDPNHPAVVVVSGMLSGNPGHDVPTLIRTAQHTTVRRAIAPWAIAVRGVSISSDGSHSPFLILAPRGKPQSPLYIGPEWRIDAPWLDLSSEETVMCYMFSVVIDPDTASAPEFTEAMHHLEYATEVHTARPATTFRPAQHPTPVSSKKPKSKGVQLSRTNTGLAVHSIKPVTPVRPVQPAPELSLSRLAGRSRELQIQFLSHVPAARVRRTLRSYGALQFTGEQWSLRVSSDGPNAAQLSAIIGSHLNVSVIVNQGAS